MDITNATRMHALTEHLMQYDGADESVIEHMEVCDHDSTRIELRHGYKGEFYVVTDAEADKKAIDYMQDTLWAFNVSFLRNFVPALNSDRAAKAWEKMAGELCEDANPLVAAMLGDRIGDFCREAIRADGRGHFLAAYDGREHEIRLAGVNFYVYRVN